MFAIVLDHFYGSFCLLASGYTVQFYVSALLVVGVQNENVLLNSVKGRSAILMKGHVIQRKI